MALKTKPQKPKEDGHYVGVRIGSEDLIRLEEMAKREQRTLAAMLRVIIHRAVST